MTRFALYLAVSHSLAETLRSERRIFSPRANRLEERPELGRDQATVPDIDEASLIADLKRGTRAAWSAAVDRHLGEVYGFVFHLSGDDRAAAEELTQET